MSRRGEERSPYLAPLRALAAEGLTVPAIAQRIGVNPRALYGLAKRHGVTVRPAPPVTKEHYRRAGQASAASARHRHFTDDDRRRALDTRRRGVARPAVVDVQARRRELVERALAKLRGAS